MLKRKKCLREKITVFMSILMICTVLLTSIAFADYTNPLSTTRTAFSLNGSWKFMQGDNAAYSSPSFDDSAWATRSVPDNGSIANDGNYTQISSDNFEGGSFGNFVAGRIGSITSNSAERITGTSSVKGTNTSGENEIMHSGSGIRLEANKVYKIKWNYRVLSNWGNPKSDRAYIYVKSPSSGDTYKQTIFDERVGTYSNNEMVVYLKNYSDYYIYFSISGSGSISLDDITVSDCSSNVFWYRKTFTTSTSDNIKYLRMDQILDKGEVWLNGTKLTNSDLHSDLASAQLGASWGFHSNTSELKMIHPVDWKRMYDVSNLIVKGGTNTIAVRVTDDPRTSYWIIRNPEDEIKSGKAGITGNVTLVKTPSVNIATIDRIHPGTVDTLNFNATHNFTVNTKNETGTAVNTIVNLIIKDSSGTVVSSQSLANQSISANGTKAVSFSWTTRARFMKYTATAEIYNGTTLLDQSVINFQGTVVETKAGRKLYVNGEPFFAKGLNGGAALTDDDISESYLQLAKLTGANAIRGDSLSQKFVSLCEQYGLMVLPSVTDSCVDFTTLINTQYGGQVVSDRSKMQVEQEILGIKESPNILAWSIGNEFFGTRYSDFTTMLNDRTNVAHNLDPYKRPTLYSNHNDEYISSGADIMAFNIYNQGSTGYQSRINSISNTTPAILTEWGMYDSVHSHDSYDDNVNYITKRMYDTVLPQGWSGTFYYSGLIDYAYRHPGVADRFNDLVYNSKMIEGIKNLYDDIAIAFSKVDSSNIKMMLINRRAYTLENVVLNIENPGYGSTPLTVGNMAPGQQIDTGNLNIGSQGDIMMKFEYTTHGGLGGIGSEQSLYVNTNVKENSVVLEDCTSVTDWTLGSASMTSYGFTSTNGVAEMWYDENVSARDTLYYDKIINRALSGNSVLSVNVKLPSDTFLTLEVQCDNGAFTRLDNYYMGNGTGDYERRYYPIGRVTLNKIRISVGEPSDNIGGAPGRKSVFIDDMTLEQNSVLEDCANVTDWTLGSANMSSYGFTSTNGVAELWYDENTSARDILYYDKTINQAINGNSVLSINVKIPSGSFLCVEAQCDGGAFKRLENYYTGNGTGIYERRYYPIGGLNLDKIRISVSEPDYDIGGAPGRISVFIDDIRLENDFPKIRHLKAFFDFERNVVGEVPTQWVNSTSNGSWSAQEDGDMVFSQGSTTENCIMTTGYALANERVNVDIKPGASASGKYQGIVLRYVDNNNYYLAALENNSVRIYKKVGGTQATIATVDYTFNTSSNYRVAAEVNGSTIKVYVNNLLIAMATDTSITSGKAGLTTYMTSAAFDNFVLEELY